MATTQYVRTKRLLEAELDEDIVALDVDGGHCFGFNSVAATIWRALDQPRDFQALHQLLLDEYDVEPSECAAELKACLADLEAKGLVRLLATGE